MKYKVIFLLFFLFHFSNSKAQDINDAVLQYNTFVRNIGNGAEGVAYDALYKSYESYLQVLNSTSSTSALHSQAKSGLKDIFPYLQNAAYYYTGLNNQARTLVFAQAYITLSVLPAMSGENLPRNENYPIFAKLAAFNTWLAGDHVKAIPFLQAYLTTGDMDRREDAFYYLSKAYYTSHNYGAAKQYLSEGILQYPNSISMLALMINVCVETQDDSKLQPYLTKALAMRPNDEGLLNNQGLLYEKNQRFEEAIDIYRRIQQMKPQSLDVARHLAQDYYNAGVQYLTMSEEVIGEGKPLKKKVFYKSGLVSVATLSKKSAKTLKQYREKAENYFRSALPILNSIMLSDPLAVKWVVAQANIYSILGDNANLQAINQKLSALGVAPILNNVKDVAQIDMNASDPAPLVASSTLTSNTTPTPVPQPRPMSVVQPTPQPQPQPVVQEPNVDTDIPINPTTNNNTFALIIANENYNKISHVPMANNDGKIFAEYCKKTLGLPSVNVREYFDASSLDMAEAIEDIQHIAKNRSGNLNVIFYYAGHGMPEEGSNEAYLLPVDANGRRTTGCLALNKLYADLGSLNAKNVYVFLDACFTGDGRDGHSINSSSRGVAIVPKRVDPRNNMVIFTATSEKETAMPYQEKKHGLFTYFLLKKLQETRGSVTFGELKDYLEQHVRENAWLINKKTQTPMVLVGSTVQGRWETLKF